MQKIHSSPLLPRRSFLKTSGKVALTTAVVTSPVANAFFPALAGGIAVSLLLDAARVMGGFIFNNLKVVTVKGIVKKALEEGTEYALEKGVEYVIDYYQGLPDDKGKLDRNVYHKEVIQVHPVRLGMSDEEYNDYREQSRKIILSREEDLQRFEDITRYLVDTKTRILLPEHNITDTITSNLTPGDLITGHLRFKNPVLKTHYEKLLEKTGVNVFQKLVA